MVKRPSTRTTAAKKTTKPRLSRRRWVEVAIQAIDEGGLEALAVEPLAARLGTTKGSFYWHFRDRADLLGAVLELWESLATMSIIDELTPVEDPRARLRQLLDVVFAGAEGDRFELAMFSATNDREQIEPVVARITTARLQFLEMIFVDMGLTPARARSRARIAYAAYIGHVQLRVLDPSGGPGPRAVRRYVDELADMLDPG